MVRLSLCEAHLALFFLFFGAISIGFAPIFVRLSELGPIATAFYRMVIALPLFTIGIFLLPSDKKSIQKVENLSRKYHNKGLMLLGGAMLAADLALWHISITMTSVANATLFNNCAPIVVVILSWFILRERISKELLVALSIASLGTIFLLGDGFSFSLHQGQLKGNLLAILTAVFYASYLLIVKHLRTTLSTNSIMCGTSAAAAVFLFFGSLFEGNTLLPQTYYSWAVVILLGLLCHVVGQSLIAHSMARLSAAFTSIGLLLQPIAAAALAWFFFQETLSTTQWFGGVLIMVGIICAKHATSSGNS